VEEWQAVVVPLVVAVTVVLLPAMVFDATFLTLHSLSVQNGLDFGF
jgi:hypothetical protein